MVATQRKEVMVILSESDYLDVKLVSLIADYDVETLSNLYQPIIGYASLAIFFTLVAEAKNQKITNISSHNQLLNRLQMAPGDFVDARKRLEAVGLLKTYLETKENLKIYHYQVYAPKAPFAFFDDALLYGMLIKAVGDTDANRFKMIYHFSIEEEQGKDISSSFIDVYQPNFEDPAFLKALGGAQAIGRRSGKANIQFNYDTFFKQLSEQSQIKQEAFTKKDMKEIARLAMLNGVTEKDAANIVARIYNPYKPAGSRIDFEDLAAKFQQQDAQALYRKDEDKEEPLEPSTVTSDSQLAAKVNLMEKVSPKDYLSILQNGSQPASSDLKIVEYLSGKMQIPNGVINVIIDYVLMVNNNVLYRGLCEKIAASLARERIVTVIDAMNYLEKMSKRRASSNKPEPNKPITTEKTEQKQPKNEENPANWDDLLDDLDDDNGGNENGKA